MRCSPTNASGALGSPVKKRQQIPVTLRSILTTSFRRGVSAISNQSFWNQMLARAYTWSRKA